MPVSENMEKLLSSLLSNVSSHLKSPLCNALVPLDLRSELIRTEEVCVVSCAYSYEDTDNILKSAAANWFADILFHCYDEALCMKGLGGNDIIILCAGALRGDSVYGPGNNFHNSLRNQRLMIFRSRTNYHRRHPRDPAL